MCISLHILPLHRRAHAHARAFASLHAHICMSRQLKRCTERGERNTPLDRSHRDRRRDRPEGREAQNGLNAWG